jgi:hypothetical protein
MVSRRYAALGAYAAVMMDTVGNGSAFLRLRWEATYPIAAARWKGAALLLSLQLREKITAVQVGIGRRLERRSSE